MPFPALIAQNRGISIQYMNFAIETPKYLNVHIMAKANNLLQTVMTYRGFIIL